MVECDFSLLLIYFNINDGEYMYKIICVLTCFSCFALSVLADELKDVQSFFNSYVAAANNYSQDYFKFYSDNAKIIRVVEKPDGTKESVNVPLSRYKSETKKSLKLMRLAKYKNYYFDVKIVPYGDNYKLSALRMPSTSDYKIPAYFVIGKDKSGNFKIKEESMNTKVQKFLEYS